MLAVVQYHQHRFGRNASTMLSEVTHPGACTPGRGHQLKHRVGIRRRRELAEPCAISETRDHFRATATRGESCPPPRPPTSPTAPRPAPSRSPPAPSANKRRQLGREIPRNASTGEAAELSRESAAQLEDPLRPRQIRNRCSPRSTARIPLAANRSATPRACDT
jgi:hypothetical protein